MSQVSVVATGVQTFNQRFPGRRRIYDDDVPLIAPWRCNLTAISQAHNLYFVAYAKDIYVYVPQFPTQALPPQPHLIFTSPPSSDQLRGYIDPRRPHTINNLVVQYLGTEEVVAVVRDDGDSEAFLVRHIVQAIERRVEDYNTKSDFGYEIRPIFQANVSNSAWGIAIHARARIIAISSNTHMVDIFEFALLDEYEQPHGTENDDAEEENVEPGLVRHRRTDVTHRVVNGQSNIPNIAFCNTGDDPKARWLLTTDISGVCRAIDLHAHRAVQAFRFGHPMPSSYVGGGYDRTHAGWLIMFLDRRSFPLASSVEDALGLANSASGIELMPGCRDDKNVWDLSDTTSYRSPAFTGYRRRTARGDRLRRHTNDPVSPSEDTWVNNLDDAEGGVSLDGIDIVDNRQNSSDDYLSDGSSDTEPELVDDDEDPEDEGTEDSVSYHMFYGGRRIHGNNPRFVQQNDLCENLPCPILHASVRNIYLLQPSNQNYHRSPFSPPMVGFAHPLRQRIPIDYAALNMFERLNMTAYIPSIGVVVCASQKGRAVILALSKVTPALRYPDQLADLGYKSNFVMRAVELLPFPTQETAGHRPFKPLHGIATGPIQGTEGLRDGEKRWRLMIMYQDHSILSYEISRRRDDIILNESIIV